MRPRSLLGLAAFALLSLGAGVRPAGLGDVKQISLEEQADQTRIVIELSAKTAFASHALDNPHRLYIDVDGVWIDGKVAAPQSGVVGSPLRVVRGGQNTLTRSRIVLELAKNAPTPKVYTLDSPFRIVAEMPKAARAEAPKPIPVKLAAVPPVSAAPVAVPVPAPAPVAVSPEALQPDWDKRAVRRIAIDAGHGGKDPGALGADRLREASVVLAIAQELRRELVSRNFEVIMTRDEDEFLPLLQRTDIANKRDVDLFLSVHANSAKNRKLAGVETYLLATSNDHQTARVAARENGTSVRQISELHLLLASLKLGNNERYAAQYANLVQSSLIRRLRKDYVQTVDLGVKRGPFLVLFQADMPAILVEVGFVSNPGEGKRLGSDSFARAAAEGIADGVSAYREQQERRILARR